MNIKKEKRTTEKKRKAINEFESIDMFLIKQPNLNFIIYYYYSVRCAHIECVKCDRLRAGKSRCNNS